MDKTLHKIAARASKKVYTRNIDLGTTEYFSEVTSYNNQFLQVISIAGSNEIKDWAINFNLASWKGIKWGAYKAAQELYKSVKIKNCPLLICGHSKAGATAIALKKLYAPTAYCVGFAPAPCLRPWTHLPMENTTIFYDPDDIVHKAGGIISFRQPTCETIRLPNDHKGLHLADHGMDNFYNFVMSQEY